MPYFIFRKSKDVEGTEQEKLARESDPLPVEEHLAETTCVETATKLSLLGYKVEWFPF